MGMMKYLRYKDAGVILFEEHLSHNTMHELIGNPIDKLISAGKVAMWSVNDELQVQAGGGSVTLGILESLDDDSELIERRLKLY